MKKILIVFVTAIFTFSCSSDDPVTTVPEPDIIDNPDPDPEPEPDPEVANSVQLVNDGTFGNVMTDSDGFTLYFFAKDSKGDSTCEDGCLAAWPAFHAEELTLDDGLEASNFASITRGDGSNQTTYKGWPLYRFASDTNAGQITGDGSGGVWFVAKPDYSVMVAKAQLVGRDAAGNETNLNSAFEPGDEETTYITDANGNTLYSFINDTNGQNNFTADDFSNNGVWPIVDIEAVNIPSILSASDFGTLDVFGESQISYKGWPLYYFVQDAERGDNFGVGFPAAGVWPTVNPDTQMAPEAEVSAKIYTVTNQGATAYVFSGEGLTDAVNPDFTFKRGETYEFQVNTPGHPFFIKSTQTTGTGDTFDDGVTENGASSGSIVFTVPNDAPDTLFYICEFHGSMTGTITIVD